MNAKAWVVSLPALLALLAAPAATRAEPVTAAEARALAAQEPGAPASDYRARTATLRLFGVQNPGTPQAFATVADTATWATRDVRVGDAIGRNLLVRAIDRDGLVLADGDRELRLGVNEDVAVRLVEHAFDVAVTPRGPHDFTVDARALSGVRARYGAGAAGVAVALDRAAVKLVSVEPRGVFARLGLQAGDLLRGFDGQPVAPGDLDRIAAALASAGGGLHALDVVRHGAAFTAVYDAR